MAQVVPATNHGLRPSTPPNRSHPTNLSHLSPGRATEPLLTSPSNRGGRLHPDAFSPVNQNGSFEFDRVIKSGKVSRRTKKKGAWKPSWKPSYLVLRPNLLSVYKNQDESQLKLSITLSEVTAVARVKKTNTDNVFGIFTPAKNFHFSTETELDTSHWVDIIRSETRTEQEQELELPHPEFQSNNAELMDSETTDLSAEDDLDRPGSPETPQWAVRGSKSRSSTQTAPRKTSNLRDYSGSELMTTSQSDFSDAAVAAGLSSSAPTAKALGASAMPNHTGKLTPIPQEGPLSMPSYQLSTSQISLHGAASSAPTPTQQQVDPNRVIRQGHLHLHKTVSGVRQWKTLWAVLRPSGLALYKSTSEYEPVKIISIHGMIDAAEIDPISKSKRYCLQIIGEEKTWKFNVDSESELEGWLGALKSVLVKRTRGLSSAHGAPQGSAPPATVNPPNPGVMMGGPVGGVKENSNPAPTHTNTQPVNIQPHHSGRGAQRADSSGIDEILEGMDEMKMPRS